MHQRKNGSSSWCAAIIFFFVVLYCVSNMLLSFFLTFVSLYVMLPLTHLIVYALSFIILICLSSPWCVWFFSFILVPTLWSEGHIFFFSTTVQQPAVWMGMYGLAFEWKENIVIPLFCSVCKILKQKFYFTLLYTAAHGCDQSVLIFWYGLSFLSRKHDCSPFGLLAILLKDIH